MIAVPRGRSFVLLAALALVAAPAAAGPWVYCVAGAGILANPEAIRDCVPPKAPESDQTPFPEGDDK